MQEVFKAIKSLKNNTSVGFNCISNEMLKHSSVNMLNCICKLFNIILKSTSFPSRWTESMMTSLFKTGDVRDPSNYRGITISSCQKDIESKSLNKNGETFKASNSFVWTDIENDHFDGTLTSEGRGMISKTLSMEQLLESLSNMKKEKKIFVSFDWSLESLCKSHVLTEVIISSTDNVMFLPRSDFTNLIQYDIKIENIFDMQTRVQCVTAVENNETGNHVMNAKIIIQFHYYREWFKASERIKYLFNRRMVRINRFKIAQKRILRAKSLRLQSFDIMMKTDCKEDFKRWNARQNSTNIKKQNT
ncbi:unnamed protein product [Mytilus coruscus]|uniref:Uncharacterized protein n=1 Tax=Mytilus coruscus TaxID=42192 RepID=A0A6J8BX73_MYTCO|nr:unnamed protein product [Mytilus coruscus]